LVRDISQQSYLLLIAVGFMTLGVWISYHLIGNKQSKSLQPRNLAAIKQLGLSAKELRVLEKMAQGTRRT